MSRLRRRPAAALLLAVLTPLAAAGCAQPVSFGAEPVACTQGREGTPANGVVLMAQSVPTATWIPCLEGLPLGWHMSDLQVRNGSARFWLDSDRNGPQAIQVLLTESCRTEGASSVPSDREGMQRLERVTQVSPQYVSRRYYVFDGGCLTILFTLTGPDRSEPQAVATQGLRTLEREALRDLVREQTDGRLELDPPPAAAP